MNAVVQETPGATPTKAKKDPTPVEVIVMQDGRKVEFAGKRKLIKTSLIPGEGDYTGPLAVQLDFRNQETRTFPLPDALLAKFAVHGAEQKLGDETAGVEDVDDMVIFVDELMDRLAKGEWSTKREGSGFAGTSILLRALVEASGKTSEAIKTFLSTKTQADKMALRNSPKIKPIVERLEAEKLAKGTKVDVGALEAELAAI